MTTTSEGHALWLVLEGVDVRRFVAVRHLRRRVDALVGKVEEERLGARSGVVGLHHFHGGLREHCGRILSLVIGINLGNE